jgi:hypothetical protein
VPQDLFQVGLLRVGERSLQPFHFGLERQLVILVHLGGRIQTRPVVPRIKGVGIVLPLAVACVPLNATHSKQRGHFLVHQMVYFVPVPVRLDHRL